MIGRRRVGDDESGDDAGDDLAADEVCVAPIGDELDLHTFLPRDCADVVEEYVRAAHEAGLTTVRIIHGKGTGTLRRIVHGVLERHAAVRGFRLAEGSSGGWGATIAVLHGPGGGSNSS
ncbi:MAG: Smr protein/MutS2 [Deltaproteobacteria bacterium]|nr:Smr protein/MutS2 [Deltaproteobacteria bacterium]